jgi:hypothetical protein
MIRILTGLPFRWWKFGSAPAPATPPSLDALSRRQYIPLQVFRRFAVPTVDRRFDVPIALRSFVAPESETIMLQSVKDPNGNETFTLSYADQIGSDRIVASSWTPPSGVVVSASAFTATTTSVRLRGGSLGQIVDVKNVVTLAGGDTLARTLRISIITQ